MVGMIDPRSYLIQPQATTALQGIAAHQAGVQTRQSEESHPLNIATQKANLETHEAAMEDRAKLKSDQEAAKIYADAAFQSWKKNDTEGFRNNIGQLATYDMKTAKGMMETLGGLDRTNFVESAFHLYNAARLDDPQTINKSLLKAADTLGVQPNHPMYKELQEIASMPEGDEKTERIFLAYNYARLWGAYGDPNIGMEAERLKVQQGNLMLRAQEINDARNKEARIALWQKFEAEFGQAPSGYSRDLKSGELYPTYGGPVYKELLGEKTQRMNMYTKNLEKGNRLITDIERANEAVDWTTAGPLGWLLKFIPATGAMDVRATIDTIKANIGFDALQEMRFYSPTGGALGQVAVEELRFLQASLENLDQSQSPEQLKRNLSIVLDHYRNFLKEAKSDMDRAQKTGINDFFQNLDVAKYNRSMQRAGGKEVDTDKYNEKSSVEDLMSVF